MKKLFLTLLTVTFLTVNLTSQVPPSGLTTITPSNITCNDATSGSAAFTSGGGNIVQTSFCYDTHTNPLISLDDPQISICSVIDPASCGSGAFSHDFFDVLLPGTTYYFKTYAVSWYGGNFHPAYGPEKSFTTLPNGIALSTNPNLCALTAFSACVQGTVTNQGCSDNTARGICWSTTVNPTIAGSHCHNGTGLGTFNGPLTNLNSHTKYYARAYATNSYGTSYGNEISFTTLSFP